MSITTFIKLDEEQMDNFIYEQLSKEIKAD